MGGGGVMLTGVVDAEVAATGGRSVLDVLDVLDGLEEEEEEEEDKFCLR